MGLPVINIPGCPAHPDWITQILVALATGRAGDIALDDLHRPQTFFKTFTQTGCTRVQFFEYKQSTTSLRRGHPHRLPVLRVRLPRPDDPLAVQPDPVEPAVVQDPGRDAVPGLHRAGVPVLRPDAGHGVQDPEGQRHRSRRKCPREPTTSPTWRTPPPPGSLHRSGPRKTCSWSERSHSHETTSLVHRKDSCNDSSVDLFVSPLGRVEGDLDVRVTIDDGVVTSAWTEAAMFRGFEIILRGKDPQAGLIVTPAHLRHLRRQPPLQAGLRPRHRVDARTCRRTRR